MSEELFTNFPLLRTTPFAIMVGFPTLDYNCIAWVAHDTKRWWWPDGLPPRFYWPPNLPREVTIPAFVAALETVGYIVGGDESLEPEFEKAALFAQAGVPTHAARQLASGRWTSKLGEGRVIEHELRALEGDLYGTVTVILKRPKGEVQT
jgi:hypothetical protein